MKIALSTVDAQGNLTCTTPHSGVFNFQIGLDISTLEPLLMRVNDAFTRFDSTPKIQQLQQEIWRMIREHSVHAANRIAGSPFDFEKTTLSLAKNLDRTKDEWLKRLRNLVHAYDFLQDLLENTFIENLPGEDKRKLHDKPRFMLSEHYSSDLHKLLIFGLEIGVEDPGEYREGPKILKTKLRGKQQFIISSLPRTREDVKYLMHALVVWANSPAVLRLPSLYRAALLHYYLALIHPFSSFNGTIARFLEASVLQYAGYQQVAFLMGTYYLENLERYDQVFNETRRQVEENQNYPLTSFVQLSMQAMLHAINLAQDKLNESLASRLYDAHLHRLFSEGKLNLRQHLILTHLKTLTEPLPVATIFSEPWCIALYEGLSDRTRKRDLKSLIDLGLVTMNDEHKIMMAFTRLAFLLSEDPFTAARR